MFHQQAKILCVTAVQNILQICTQVVAKLVNE